MSWEERKSWHKPIIFFLVFCFSYNMLVRWFRLYKFASCVRPLLGTHPQNWARKFLSILTSSWLVFSPRFYIFVSSCLLTSKSKLSFYFCLVSTRGTSVSDGFSPAQKIWDLRFFLVIFNYRSHSPVTGWRKQMLKLESFRGPPAASVDSLFAFSSYLFLLSLSLSLFLRPPKKLPLV